MATISVWLRALGEAEAKLTPLENSVRKAADDVLAETKPGDEELTALRDAFVPAMVRVNDQGEYVRRPARWHDLPSKSHPLLERLAKARLVIVSQQGDDRMVEVAHEALLRKWPRLRAWLDEAREFLAGKQQLEVDLRDWERATKADKPDALLAGLKLHRAQGWLLARPQQLSEKERVYIQASIDQAERRRRIVTWGSIAAAAVLACVAVFAGLQWRAALEAGAEARDQRDHAVQAEIVAEKAKVEAQASADQAKANFREAQIVQSRLLADLAGRKRAAQSDAGVAVLLALEALPDAAVTARPYVPEAELQLDGAFRDLHESLVLGHSDQVWRAAFSPDGKRIVTAFANMARVWDAATGRPIGEPLRGHSSVVWNAAYSADGKRIVTASGDKTARIWDAETGQPVGEPLRGHDGGVRRAAFSSDGKRIATASEDGTARLWNAATGQPIGEPLRGHEAQVWSAAFSPTASASSRRLTTGPHASGTPRLASRSASRSEAMTVRS
jgi:WD domain, G-beta repeat